MSIQFRDETLRIPTPRTARFLSRSIPRAAAAYVPAAAETRAEGHQPGTCSPETWPVRLTRCGEHPGRWGDNTPARTLQVAQ